VKTLWVIFLKLLIDLNSAIGPFFNFEKDRLIVQIHKTLKGFIFKESLKKALIKKFNVSDIIIHFYSKNRKFFLEIISNYQLPQKEEVVNYLNFFISNQIYKNLTNTFTQRRIFYITKESRIPLIGSIYFGIIDRGTNLLQIRPITGCILNCPFCSVDEGPRSKTRWVDYIIEPNYLLEEIKKVIEFKKVNDIEIHLDGQGEPLTYPYLIDLIKNLSKNVNIKVISMQTNGILLNKETILKLKKAGLNRINLSLNSLDPKEAIFLSGIENYSLKNILKKIDIIKNSGMELLIAPVIIPGINEDQIEPIIKLILKKQIKSNWPVFGFQNYISYRYGRRMKAKPKSFSQFNKELRDLEKKYDVKLLLSPKDFNIYKIKSIKNPIKKGEIIDAKIVLPGRTYRNEFEREMLATAKNRLIHVINCNYKVGDIKKIQIFRNKHNINYGKII